MGDCIPIKTMIVTVQENGIIRNDKGRIIARFIDDVEFDGEHIYDQEYQSRLNKLANRIHQNNKDKGFYDSEKNIGEMLALIHSEVSEALECDRKEKYCGLDNENWKIANNSLREDLDRYDDLNFKEGFEMYIKDTFEDELADIMIRVMDLAGYKEIDLETHIAYKVRYNTLRPHKHGKKY